MVAGNKGEKKQECGGKRRAPEGRRDAGCSWVPARGSRQLQGQMSPRRCYRPGAKPFLQDWGQLRRAGREKSRLEDCWFIV